MGLSFYLAWILPLFIFVPFIWFSSRRSGHPANLDATQITTAVKYGSTIMALSIPVAALFSDRVTELIDGSVVLGFIACGVTAAFLSFFLGLNLILRMSAQTEPNSSKIKQDSIGWVRLVATLHGVATGIGVGSLFLVSCLMFFSQFRINDNVPLYIYKDHLRVGLTDRDVFELWGAPFDTSKDHMLYLTENHQIVLCFEYGKLIQIAAIGRYHVRIGICGTD